MRNSVTVRGQWMYPRTANVGMIRLVASGTLDLEHDQVTSFTVDFGTDVVTLGVGASLPAKPPVR
jgi:hypothetical protein